MENQKSALGLDANITALLGYIIWIIALIMIFIEKENKFVRFHAFQSLLYSAAIFVVFIVLSVLTAMMAFVSSTLASLFSLLFILMWLAAFAGMIFLAIKSYQGQKFKLPMLGDIAEKYS